MLPKDPMILLSFVNTKLRDEFSSLGGLCERYGADPEDLKETLARAGFTYEPTLNQFR